MSAGGLVEVATRHHESIFRLAQFDLYTETFAHTDILRHLTGEDQIHIKHAVLHFGHYLGNLQRITLALVVYGSRETGGDAVDVVFAQLGMNLELVEHLDFGNVRVGAYLLSRSGLHITQLTVDRGTHHESFQAFHASEILFLSSFHFVTEEVLTNNRHSRVVAKAFHLKSGLLQVVVILGFAHFQLCLTLDTHFEFFLFQTETLLQAVHFVLGL